eukprot:3148330-Rhodomonas_salina.2
MLLRPYSSTEVGRDLARACHSSALVPGAHPSWRYDAVLVGAKVLRMQALWCYAYRGSGTRIQETMVLPTSGL